MLPTVSPLGHLHFADATAFGDILAVGFQTGRVAHRDGRFSQDPLFKAEPDVPELSPFRLGLILVSTPWPRVCYLLRDPPQLL